MKKYRVVELSGGGYGIQCKNNFWSFWRLLPLEPIAYSMVAYAQVDCLKKIEEEYLKKKKELKVKSVHKKID